MLAQLAGGISVQAGLFMTHLASNSQQMKRISKPRKRKFVEWLYSLPDIDIDGFPIR
tara:strand:- start:87 stop:257 length:171 start_codon:yes stop_codon:yes gene_type:complete